MKNLFNSKSFATQNLLSKITRRSFFLLSILYILASSPSASALTSVTTSSAGDVRSGLIGYWTFDGKNMTNATATDSSGRGVDGTLTNSPTKTLGKIGQALQLNGTNNYVDMGTTTTLQPSFPFSISVWVKFNSIAVTSFGSPIVTSSDIASNGQYTGFTLSADSSGSVYMSIGASGGCCDPAFRNTFITSAGAVTTGKWYHIVATVTNVNTMSVYVNGVLQSGAQSGSAASMVYPSTSRFRVGAVYEANTPGTVYLNGFVDDVRLYNRVLSLKEAQSLYKAGGGTIAAVTPGKSSNGSNSVGVNNGLVGYWTFDGTNMTNTTATDISGSGNNGTLTNMTASSSAAMGKIGQALTFNGTSNYFKTGNATALDFNGAPLSVSVWINPTTNVTDQIIYSSGYDSCCGTEVKLALNSTGGHGTGVIEFSVEASGHTAYGSVAIPTRKWSHIIGIYDGTTINVYVNSILAGTVAYSGGISENNNVVSIGARLNAGVTPSLYFNGLIDDVRVYNRALSTFEIQSLYKAGGGSVAATSPSNTNYTGINSGLVGYWTFDGKNMTNATATDISGNNNNGTLTNMTATSSATMGKIGQALNFFPKGTDTNAYVSAGDPVSGVLDFGTGDFSVSFWMKGFGNVWQGSGFDTPVIKSNYNAGLQAAGYSFYYVSDNKMAFVVGDGSTGYQAAQTVATAGDGKWHHYTGLRSGSVIYLYVDSILAATSSVSGSVSNTVPLTIGGDSGIQRNTNAVIDDVRIYNRTISLTEVRSLYKLGSQ